MLPFIPEKGSHHHQTSDRSIHHCPTFGRSFRLNSHTDFQIVCATRIYYIHSSWWLTNFRLGFPAWGNRSGASVRSGSCVWDEWLAMLKSRGVSPLVGGQRREISKTGAALGAGSLGVLPSGAEAQEAQAMRSDGMRWSRHGTDVPLQSARLQKLT